MGFAQTPGPEGAGGLPPGFVLVLVLFLVRRPLPSAQALSSAEALQLLGSWRLLLLPKGSSFFEAGGSAEHQDL